LNVFSLYETPIGKKLGIQPLAGDLFSTHAMPHLYQCQLNNHVLLEVFRGLCFFENEQGQYLPVNYKSLDVEEFGSVYEGLLELDPAIDVTARRFSFVQGDDRSISGSHYTPDELVQPLIKHSLEHLIQDIISPSGGGKGEDEETKIKKLLQLTVCDVACGSGHILLAAARRIGLAVARLRSGEEQPNPADTRKGIRDAIKHCIYGVDKNPLAVELCKVAMWLEAHVPGEPLNFLDHKIKNGDAIVGLAHLDELYNGIATEAFKAHRDEEKENCRLLKASNRKQRQARETGQLRTHNVKEIIENKLAKFKEKFKTFQTLPENTAEEIEVKKQAYKKLNSGTNWWAVKTLADLQVAQFFVDKTDITNVVTDDDYFDIMAGRKAQTKAEVMAIAEAELRKFFHWFLEFPEVFGRGGFDCILGNPPFLGGLRVSTNYGKNYFNFIQTMFPFTSGKCDLVAFFFRNAFKIICQNSFVSLISTNSISQGATREGGLDQIVKKGGEIIFAESQMSWPGLANVNISLLTMYKGVWKRFKVLDKKQIPHINNYLTSDAIFKPPYILDNNRNKAFIGSVILGKGFSMEPNKANDLIKISPKNKDVLHPYLNGKDFNSSPDQGVSRWIINFFDWPMKYCKEEYPECFRLVESTVKLQRSKVKKKSYKENWWMYAEKGVKLYNQIEKNKEVLVTARVSKTLGFAFVASKQVFDDKILVIDTESFSEFSYIQSTLHNIWAWQYSTKMKADLSYTPRSVYQTFPFPIKESASNRLEAIGEIYHEFRRQLMLDIQLGLTKTYNQFHNKDLVSDVQIDISKKKSSEIKKAFSKESWNLYNHLQKTEGTIPFKEAVEKTQELRRHHVEMDLAVLEAYGWHQSSKRWGAAIELRHDFYEVDYLPENDRVRYTIHPEARKEVLKRLLLLNHEIHESEEQGIPY
ncbi:MAG: hypothetical protein KI786_09040, partial [Mameliella sp.]|nr:hypothetical protein [Phaeodactylibacter sp.]